MNQVEIKLSKKIEHIDNQIKRIALASKDYTNSLCVCNKIIDLIQLKKTIIKEYQDLMSFINANELKMKSLFLDYISGNYIDEKIWNKHKISRRTFYRYIAKLRPYLKDNFDKEKV